MASKVGVCCPVFPTASGTPVVDVAVAKVSEDGLLGSSTRSLFVVAAAELCLELLLLLLLLLFPPGADD